MIAIDAEFTGEAYRQIMEFCFLKSDAVSLTYHNHGMPFKRNIRDIRKSLRPYRISSSCNLRKHGKEYDPWSSESADSRWFRADRAEQLFEDTYRLTEEIREYILAVDGIYAWEYPDRPEELTFYKADKLWFWSRSHEGLRGCCVYDNEREMRLLLNKLKVDYAWSRSDD